MTENELEVVIICSSCHRKYDNLEDLMVWHVPKQLIEQLNIKQRPHLKCICCRNNTFIIRVIKDKYGEYPE